MKILEKRTVFEVPGRYSVVEVDLETPKGQTTWTYIHSKHGSVIVPIDEEGNTFIKGEWRLSREEHVWEFASGWVDESGDTTPSEGQIIAAANRELQEEIGFKAAHLELAQSFYTSNHADNQFHIVVATDLTESKLEGDEHEFLTVKKVSYEEAKKYLLEDQVPTSQTLAAFYEYEKRIKEL